MAISALPLLEEGLELYRRSFRSELWRYYIASVPLVAALLWTWQRIWPAAEPGFAPVVEPALVLTLCAGLRLLGTGAYNRRLLAACGSTPPRRSGGNYLAELGSAPVLALLWWLGLPLLLGIGLFYTATQYLPFMDEHPLHRALGLARRWWLQQWALLGIILLLGACVFVNLAIVALLLPPLLHALLGLGGTLGFTGTSLFLVRTSLFWFALAIATYLALEPVVICAMAISFQQLQAAREGLDLVAAVRRLDVSSSVKAKAATVAAIIVGLVALSPSLARTQAPAKVNSAVLQRAIQQELNQPAYAWQHPAPPQKAGWLGSQLGRLMASALETLAAIGRAFARILKALAHWLSRWLNRSPVLPAAGKNNRRWERWELALALLCLLLLGGLMLARRRRATSDSATTRPQLAVVNVETAGPADQDEAEWFSLAARLQEGGQLRLALRAAFLGGLAGLGQRRVVTLRRDRTNREYFDEFSQRIALLRSRTSPDELRRDFSENIRAFNEVWYGGRNVDGERLDLFITAQRRLLANV